MKKIETANIKARTPITEPYIASLFTFAGSDGTGPGTVTES